MGSAGALARPSLPSGPSTPPASRGTALGCSQSQQKPPKKEEPLLLFSGVSSGDVPLKSSECTEIKVRFSLCVSEFLLKQKLLSSHGGKLRC